LCLFFGANQKGMACSCDEVTPFFHLINSKALIVEGRLVKSKPINGYEMKFRVEKWIATGGYHLPTNIITIRHSEECEESLYDEGKVILLLWPHKKAKGKWSLQSCDENILPVKDQYVWGSLLRPNITSSIMPRSLVPYEWFIRTVDFLLQNPGYLYKYKALPLKYPVPELSEVSNWSHYIFGRVGGEGYQMVYIWLKKKGELIQAYSDSSMTTALPGVSIEPFTKVGAQQWSNGMAFTVFPDSAFYSYIFPLMPGLWKRGNTIYRLEGINGDTITMLKVQYLDNGFPIEEERIEYINGLRFSKYKSPLTLYRLDDSDNLEFTWYPKYSILMPWSSGKVIWTKVHKNNK